MGVHEDSLAGEEALDAGGLDEGNAMASALRSGTKLLTQRIQSRRVPLLSREMNPQLATISKSGNVRHSAGNESRFAGKSNDIIVKAMRSLQDPHHRAQVRSKIKSKGLQL
jgi:hypothetical protein